MSRSHEPVNGDDGGMNHDASGPHPRDFGAVLFDMDGTLVDSEPIWFSVLRAVVPDFGGDLPADAQHALHGYDRATSTTILQDRYGMTGEPATFWERVVERLTVELRHATAMPNAGVWVEATAEAGIPCAVVSNSPRAMVESSLDAMPWARHVPVRISVDDVPRGKPDPAIYLLAAERLGVDPSSTLVIEDSEAGARAGVAAGATCLFVTNGVVDPDRARAITPHVVRELPALDRFAR